ncbi:MAG TPA: catalase [Flavobacteriales bacterium]|nr:catalase [Flavobacteriales bacterium]
MAKRTTPRKRTAPSDPKLADLRSDATDGTDQVLTTNQGLAINDNQNSLKAGVRGPSLLEDHILREKITHFDHERIPERVVHARGAGAHGHFQVYKSLAKWTKAGFLNDPSRRTPVFVRFSTVAGSKGSTDLARDVRGFAVKFYTEEGIYDLVGNNIPVFFIQDAMKFPDLIHSVKPEAHHEMPQAASAHDTFWDFISLMPESMHMIMWAMSDRAIPRSFRMMEGFGVHTFRFVNEAGESRFVKFHWKPLLGVHSVAWDEATKISGKDPDFHRRDLWEAIENGDFPEWELGVQVIEARDEHKFPFDLLDPTKLIPEELVPVQRVGRLTLDRNPMNFFAETEQVAFHPAHLVPGIDFTNDPLLQGRLFSYTDTQLSRLGSANFNELPINRPLAPVHNNQRDGHMRRTINAHHVNYEPNTLGGGCPYQAMMEEGGFVSFPEPMEDMKVRAKSGKFMDHFSQAALFFRSQSAPERDHLINALRFELGKVETPAVRERVIGLLAYVDRELAEGVAAAFNIAVPDVEMPLNRSVPGDTAADEVQPYDEEPPVERSAALSMADTVKDTIRTRRVAILAEGDGVRQAVGLKGALEKEGAMVKIIAPTLGSPNVDHSLMTTPSVVFDAIAVVGAFPWSGSPDAKDFVSDAFRHCKAIAFIGDADGLLRKWGLAEGDAAGPGVVVGPSAKWIPSAERRRAKSWRGIEAREHAARPTDPRSVTLP